MRHQVQSVASHGTSRNRRSMAGKSGCWRRAQAIGSDGDRASVVPATRNQATANTRSSKVPAGCWVLGSKAANALRQARSHEVLTVRGYTTFLVRWLIPRLPAFQAAHPDVEIRLEASAEPVDFRRDQADVAVLYGNGAWPDLKADLLFRDELVPVCSAQLAGPAGKISLAQLLELRLHVVKEGGGVGHGVSRLRSIERVLFKEPSFTISNRRRGRKAAARIHHTRPA